MSNIHTTHTDQTPDSFRASPDRNVEFLTWRPGRKLILVGTLCGILELSFAALYEANLTHVSVDLALLSSYSFPLFFILASSTFRFVALPERSSAAPRIRAVFDTVAAIILGMGTILAIPGRSVFCEAYFTFVSQYLAVVCAVWTPVLVVVSAPRPIRQKEPSLHGIAACLRRIGPPSPVLAALFATAVLSIFTVHRFFVPTGTDVSAYPSVVRTLAAVWTFTFTGAYSFVLGRRRYRKHDERPDIAHASAEGVLLGGAFLSLVPAPFAPLRVAVFSILYVCARLVRFHTIAQRHRKRLIKANDNEYLSLYYKACSDIDGMTGLYNKQYFIRTVPSLMERCKADQSGLALLMVDIDKFKRYNDTFGHLAGDRALIFTARVMQSTLRKTDMPFRYGGEEFCAVLVGAEEPAAVAIAERIRNSVMMKSRMLADEAIAEHLVQPASDGEIPDMSLTISVGVAMMCGSDTMNSLVVRADGALYRAKNSGRNRTECA